MNWLFGIGDEAKSPTARPNATIPQASSTFKVNLAPLPATTGQVAVSFSPATTPPAKPFAEVARESVEAARNALPPSKDDLVAKVAELEAQLALLKPKCDDLEATVVRKDQGLRRYMTSTGEREKALVAEAERAKKLDKRVAELEELLAKKDAGLRRYMNGVSMREKDLLAEAKEARDLKATLAVKDAGLRRYMDGVSKREKMLSSTAEEKQAALLLEAESRQRELLTMLAKVAHFGSASFGA